MSSQESCKLPESSFYIPFMATPEFLKVYEHPRRELVQYSTETAPKEECTKHDYIPTPTDKPSENKNVDKHAKPTSKSLRTQQRKARRLRQSQENKQKKKPYIVPTSMIPLKDPYWFPVFWASRKPTNGMDFKKTFVNLKDKLRVVVKSYIDGRITARRLGVEVVLRKANSFGIGIQH